MDPSSYSFPPKSPSSWRSSPRRPSRSSPSHKPPRLGAISEDDALVAPDLPPRAHNRPLQRMFHLGFPPVYGAQGDKAPEYSEEFPDYRDVKGPRGENFQDLRHNRHITQRGGWKRLVAIVAIVVSAVAIGVGVGLGVGLSRTTSDRPSEPSSPAIPPPPNQKFPLGSYTFTTFLSTVAKSCTPNPSTWSCFPYKTYNDSADGSITPFYWIITSSDDNPTSSNPAEYLISSTNNPFALAFSDTPLRLIDQGSDREALSFTVPMQKIVFPDTDISGSGFASLCQYNDTLFSAKLYTKMEKTYPAPAASGAGAGGLGENNLSTTQFEDWPYAVEINQTVSGGRLVPDCYRVQNGKPVEQIQLAEDGIERAECACRYLNFGT